MHPGSVFRATRRHRFCVEWVKKVLAVSRKTGCGQRGLNLMDQPVKLGLALGGGVARGMAHVGVLQALEQAGVAVHAVAGSSAGALVGALYAAGLDSATLERVALQMNWRGLVRLRLRREGLLDASGLEHFLASQVGDLDFSQLRIPFAAVACDLITGSEVVLQEGRVATAVRASSAYPGIFLPVRDGGRVLVDGGVVNNVPTSVVRSLGADRVIAVDVSRPKGLGRQPRNLLHMILDSVTVMSRPRVTQALEAADVVVQPDLSDFSAVELERGPEMIRLGREAMEAALPQVMELLGRPQP